MLTYAYNARIDGIYYDLASSDDGNTAVVTYYKEFSKNKNAYSGVINIPSKVTYEGVVYDVCGIYELAFYGCSGLTSVTIPNSVRYIYQGAFNGCSNLTFVSISSSVTSINNTAFLGCSSLAYITVEDGNTVYDSRGNCNAIIKTANNELVIGCKNTIIPNSVTSIGMCAFHGNTGLTSLTIPQSVTSIGLSAFSGCSSLTSVNIPNSVTFIGLNAFVGTGWYNNQSDGFLYLDNWLLGCKGWNPEGKLAIVDGTKGIAEEAFCDCRRLTSVIIPQSVISIGKGAFSGCDGLTSLTIPQSVSFIGESAFYGCYELEDIIALPETPPSVGGKKDLFSNYNHITLIVPSSARHSYMTTKPWCNITTIRALSDEDLKKKGDANGDGTINVEDIVDVVNYIVGSPSELFRETLADANDDGIVNVADILKIVNIIMEN